MRDSYATSHFLDWFSKEREDILTKEQIRFLSIMKYFQRDRFDEYTIPYSQLPDKCKPYSESARDHHKRRIKGRIENAYANAEKKSLREMAEDRELEFGAEFMEIVEIDDQNSKCNSFFSYRTGKRNKTSSIFVKYQRR
ncbi:hypothetical protein P4637_09460 [Halalkalibacterium halodurans]|nr:hypothetical protein [Halalkalibacterium halodurans]MED4080879.1 hypothetical protein [Halalkalibacterium halodurans]MED4085062.1 hypothetical protein [Halalkalibacterium halodurans]MED4105360.1 hypothetical protein [Halalkalibacterium halodurans]MED4109169.1 hypothetical protein [Halalkalibacterium halodurans]MED4126145.1 hypothetical protein [Halalkalibacterium halodurans]